MAQPGALALERLASPLAATAGRPGGPNAASQTITLAVENMVCGGCMRKVETALAAVPGVISARANLSAARHRRIREAASGAKLIDALGAIGFRAAELAPEADTRGNAGAALLTRLAVAGFAAANIMLFSVSVWAGSGTQTMQRTSYSIGFRDDRGAGRGLCRAAVFQLGLGSAEAMAR